MTAYRPTTLRDRLVWLGARWIVRPLLRLPWPPGPLWRAFRLAFRSAAPRRVRAGLSVGWRRIGPLDCRVATPGGGGPTVLWLHGGAFVAGSPAAHARLTDPMAATGLRVVAPAYPLAPEHPFPAAHDAALATARALAAEGPFALGGDSAGATLAASILAPLLAKGIRPMRVALLAPAALLDPSRRVPDDARPAFLSQPLLLRLLDAYAPGADPDDPRLSPARAAFPDCPSVLIHCSKGELLEPDADALADAMRTGGGTVTVAKAHGLPHAWHLAIGIAPAAGRAVADVAAFLRGVAEPMQKMDD